MLQHTVVLHTNRSWLDRLWFLRDAEPAFLIKVVLSMQQAMFVPGEMPPEDNFYAIVHGIVLCRGKILGSNKVRMQPHAAACNRVSPCVAACRRVCRRVQLYHLW